MQLKDQVALKCVFKYNWYVGIIYSVNMHKPKQYYMADSDSEIVMAALVKGVKVVDGIVPALYFGRHIVKLT